MRLFATAEAIGFFWSGTVQARPFPALPAGSQAFLAYFLTLCATICPAWRR